VRATFSLPALHTRIHKSMSSAVESSPLGFLSENPISAALASINASFRERRRALGLKNPGTVENISREVLKDVFLNNHTFSGMRADLMKSYSMNPVFQISHAFSMGAQGLPPYTLATVFGNDKVSFLFPRSIRWKI
jgi:mitochondrial import receptor subunit TOM40